MAMLTKLKYAGVPKEDLITVYILYIRSLLEYCSVVWHSTLTDEQCNNLDSVQRLSLNIIFKTKSWMLSHHYLQICFIIYIAYLPLCKKDYNLLNWSTFSHLILVGRHINLEAEH